MRRIFAAAVLACLAIASTAVMVQPAGAEGAGRSGRQLPAHADRDVCTLPGQPALARCHAKVVTNADGVTPLATSSYQFGYGPADLASAYALGGAQSTAPAPGPTIAIVDAYDNPNAEADLAVYRSQFGLPSCTTANGCFRKVNQSGGSAMPSGNVGWGQEIALDIDMASAICPTCKILLVEANSNSFADLGTAVNWAASQAGGAVAISNSYGTSGEFQGETSYDGYYNHPGIAVTVSSGDSGYGVEYPAASPNVVAVGGTSLSHDSSARGWSESAWSGAGSGCSTQESKPSWQRDSGCSKRTVADVSAVADPNTGVAVYDSYGSTGGNNWYVFGGTSVSAPIIAAVYALAGQATWFGFAYPAEFTYGHTPGLFDVMAGSNGRCTQTRGKKTTGAAYLCTAGPSYDGPTGLGTPNGTTAF